MAITKKRLLPPTPSTSPDSDDSLSDNDAPEALTLSQTKREVKKRDKDLREADERRKEKIKERNRGRDKRLKEQAEGRKKRRNEDEDEVGDVEEGGDEEDADGILARMERAMKDAEAEMDDEGEGDDDEDDDEEEEDEDDTLGSLEDLSDLEGEESGDSEDWEEDDETNDEEETPKANKRLSKKVSSSSSSKKSLSIARLTPPQSDSSKSNPKANYLPDEIFTSAFAAASSDQNKKRKREEKDSSKASATKKRRGKPKSTTDIVVGSRVIRSLNTNSSSAPSTLPSKKATLPSGKINRFLDRTLALKSGKAKGRGWERKPANLGVMKSSGPAASFVRNR